MARSFIGMVEDAPGAQHRKNRAGADKTAEKNNGGQGEKKKKIHGGRVYRERDAATKKSAAKIFLAALWGIYVLAKALEDLFIQLLKRLDDVPAESGVIIIGTAFPDGGAKVQNGAFQGRAWA